ncbi:MAG: hypothetical protein R3C16_13245 [Hyphomonadaceae bacterium]
MLLRRFIAHMRKQEWTAFAIDFVLIVFGVYLGMLLNEMRAQHTLEQAAEASLVLLADDLNQDIERLDLVAASQQSRLAALQRAVDELSAARPSDAVVGENIVAAIGDNKTLMARRTNFDAMQAEGQLNVIDPDLRRLIRLSYGYDFPTLAEFGLKMDEAQDGILASCVGRYFNFATRRLIARTAAEREQLQSCLGYLQEFSRYYVAVTEGETRSNAEQLAAALDAHLGAR